MKNSTLSLASVILTATLITTGCSSAEQKVKEAKENVAEANEEVKDATVALVDANQEYEADIAIYRATTQEKIESNNKLITDLKARIKAEKKEVKAEYTKKIEALE